MPMTPGPDEKESEFISRCIKHEVDKGHPQDQAAAICYSYWNKFSQIRDSIEVGATPGKKRG